LQHPHELKMKNRSLPIVELCLRQRDREETENIDYESNWAMDVTILRRLGDKVDPFIMSLLQETENVLLFYPFGPKVMSLKDGVKTLMERRSARNSATNNLSTDENGRITLVFIDATWTYAKEMVRANDTMNLWPHDLVRVRLSSTVNNHIMHESDEMKSKKESYLLRKTEDDFMNSEKGSAKCCEDIQFVPDGYRPRRFDIRTPPTDNHLSTAESIAWVVSYIECKPSLYTDLMKPLDEMVSHWHCKRTKS